MNLNPGSYLLDTNVLIKIQSDPSLLQQIPPQSRLFIPSPAMGEWYYGAEKSARPEKNLGAIERLIEDLFVLNVDLVTARWYGRIKAKLDEIGRPIPDNDIWVAAMALRFKLILLTNDQNHFQHVSAVFPVFSFSPF